MSERSFWFRLLRFPPMPAAEAQVLAGQVQALVAADLAVESVQVAREQEREGAVVLRGRLLRPSHEVFPHWLAALNARGCTPVLRPDPGQPAGQVVLHILPVVAPKGETRAWINLLLFIATVISTLFVGAIYAVVAAGEVAPSSATEFVLTTPTKLILGFPFMLTMLSILTAHEFGHYFAARFHKVAVTLPYFIPLPLALGVGGGTLGAFIQLREPVPDRRRLFDIGVAGPLAGLVLAIPLLLWGLSVATLSDLPRSGPVGMEGNSILYYLAKWWAFGRPIPDWVAYQDIALGEAPVVAAAWFGLLVTAINLLPVGQLDGGHAVFALFGDKARYVNRACMGLLFLLALASLPPVYQYWPWLEAIGYQGWFIWLALLYFLIGPYHPPPLDEVTELDPKRRWVGYAVIVIFILIFVPTPIREFWL